MSQNEPERPPLRQRVREAGGWYAWLNSNLIRVAGPASVGPYETTPPPATTDKPCPICGAAMSAHTIDRSGPRTQLYCP